MQSNFFDKSRTATIRIPRVFEEFLQSLADAKVRYLLIGGFAVSFHVRPRPTEDLDVWIELSEANADAVVDAFDRFGFKNVDRNAFLVRNKIARAGEQAAAQRSADDHFRCRVSGLLAAANRI